MAESTQFLKYDEHASAALNSCLPHLERLGASLSGIGGNDDHHYGYHLSKVRLEATGHADDYSLEDAWNTPVVDDHAACAIDVGFGWKDAGEWLEALRKRRQAGQLPQVVELIGDPDLLPGPPVNAVKALYAAASTNWNWTVYTGTGHTAWCHVAVGRKYANWTGFGDAVFGWWPDAKEGDDMAAVPQEQWNRVTKQLDALSDAVNGGSGEAYHDSVLRKDHGFQIDEIDRRVQAYVDPKLAELDAKLDRILAALNSHAPA